MLRTMTSELKRRRVYMVHQARARNTKELRASYIAKLICERAAKRFLVIQQRDLSPLEVPSDGFEIPASLQLVAPAVVSQSIKAAIWQSVW